MPTFRSTSRSTTHASANARDQILGDLKDDHKRVKKAYRDFQKMDSEEAPEACKELVDQVLDELTVHVQLEEELLYPAARSVIDDGDLMDEAEVEHESVKTLIEQLRAMSPLDEKYAARFTVLCEYVQHHVKEEEGEMFPKLERAHLDWENMATEMTKRRQEMAPDTAGFSPDADLVGAASEDSVARQKRKPAARKRS
mgnify:CR=1 FL=1